MLVDLLNQEDEVSFQNTFNTDNTFDKLVSNNTILNTSKLLGSGSFGKIYRGIK